MKIIFTISLFLLSFLTLSAQDLEQKIQEAENELQSYQQKTEQLKTEIASLKLQKVQADIAKMMIPTLEEGDKVIAHSAMSLCYSEKDEQAKWVAHIILPDIKNGNESRSNDFREDPLVETGTAVKDDYWYSGFDRGHLAPSADFRWNKTALSESYFYSNMAPQRPELNREGWAQLEDLLRGYVQEHNEPLYVYTGGILEDGLPTFGKINKISIPKQFYKIAYDITGDTVSAIGFLFPNGACPEPTLSYAVTIDSIEALTGIDFFPALDDELENKLESELNLEQWHLAKNKQDVLPIHRTKLPEGAINSVMAQSYYDKKAKVCGTVVSVKVSKSGNYFLNFDQVFPNQIFWATIWKSDVHNFSYDIEKTLLNQKICVSGVVKEKYGKPSMSISNEKKITFYDEEMEK